jgi:hypothetical protein
MNKSVLSGLKNLLAALSMAALASTGMSYVTTVQAAEEGHASGGGHSSGGGSKGGSGHSATEGESGHKGSSSSGGASKSLEGKVFGSGAAGDEHGAGKGKGKGPKYKGGKSGESSQEEGGHSHDK